MWHLGVPSSEGFRVFLPFFRPSHERAIYFEGAGSSVPNRFSYRAPASFSAQRMDSVGEVYGWPMERCQIETEPR